MMDRKGERCAWGRSGVLSLSTLSHLQNDTTPLQASWQNQMFRPFWKAKRAGEDLASAGVEVGGHNVPEGRNSIF